jgi:hypothetical protein
MNLQPIIDLAKPLFTLDLFRTLIASAFGTLAGAWISSRSQTKKAILEEISSVSAAIELSVSICNQYLSLKRQLIRPIRNRYVQVQQDYESYQARLQPHSQQFALQTDFQTISQVKTPTEALERCLFERISIRGRGLVAGVAAISAIDALHSTIEYRNEMIDEFRKGPPRTQDETRYMYLGLRSPQGVIDQRFGDNIAGLHALTDDCIFFSRLLADDLVQYGNKLRRRYRFRFRLAVPKFKPSVWTFAGNLLPLEADYQNWLRGFKAQPTKLARFKSWICAQFH